jgi:hypothetical protein
MTPYLVLMSAGVLALLALADAEPVRLHPDNPHYFLFRGKPTLLITSGEHYGSVLNLDFDYAKYLDTLRRDGMNSTRLFLGNYCEPDGAFNITRNTLAPGPGRLICPWARSDTPGYHNGGNKFDLTRWDEAWFARLKDFVARASEAGVVVEANLFCPFYGDEQWVLSPMNAVNNVNNIGNVVRTEAYRLGPDDGLPAIQEALTRKVVTELRGCDNLYYEIMNEPYWGNLGEGWQHHIAQVITDTETALGCRHLISQNIANDKAKVDDPDPLVSIFNFHYACPPETVGMNYALARPIGDNETGFHGTGEAYYRKEGWAFILAGGSLYNNLDYSFTVGHEDGTFELPPTQPGTGGAEFRRQLGVLRDFITAFDFLKLAPAPELLRGDLPAGTRVEILAESGKQYAAYLYRLEPPADAEAATLYLDLPPGDFRAEWVNPLTGAADIRRDFTHPGGEASLTSPAFTDDIALRILPN